MSLQSKLLTVFLSDSNSSILSSSVIQHLKLRCSSVKAANGSLFLCLNEDVFAINTAVTTLGLIQEVQLNTLHPLDFFFLQLNESFLFILILTVSRQHIVCGNPEESHLAVPYHPSYCLSMRLDAASSGF